MEIYIEKNVIDLRAKMYDCCDKCNPEDYAATKILEAHGVDFNKFLGSLSKRDFPDGYFFVFED